MKKNNGMLFLAVGFTGLCVISFFWEVNSRIIAGLGLFTFLLAISQAIDSQLDFSTTILEEKVDIFNETLDSKCDEKMIAFLKNYVDCFTDNRKTKIWSIISSSIKSVAYIVLFASFVVPFDFPSKINNAISIASCALVFFSMWLVDCQQFTKGQWKQFKLFLLLFKDNKIAEQDKETQL